MKHTHKCRNERRSKVLQYLTSSMLPEEHLIDTMQCFCLSRSNSKVTPDNVYFIIHKSLILFNLATTQSLIICFSGSIELEKHWNRKRSCVCMASNRTQTNGVLWIVFVALKGPLLAWKSLLVFISWLVVYPDIQPVTCHSTHQAWI